MPEMEGLKFQFSTMTKQREVAQLGMWVFLATEVLFFGVLFACYIYYRVEFPQAFAEAGAHVKPWEGLIMTLILVTADLFATLGLREAERGHSARVALFLLLAAAFGLAFLGLHIHEYFESAHEGLKPVEWYQLKELAKPGASLFFTLFWLMTGWHMFHVTIGVGLLSTLAVRALMLDYSETYHNPVEIGAMYWHFVDIVWTFLFPILYLRP